MKVAVNDIFYDVVSFISSAEHNSNVCCNV